MAESSYERGYREGAAGRDLSQAEPTNIFTRRFGPLPLWAWMALALLLAIGYYMYRKNSAANAAASTSGTSTADTSQIPQFVNQTYVENQPPNEPVIPSPGGGSGGGGGGGGGGGKIKVPNYINRPLEETLLKLKDIGLAGKGDRPATKGKTRIITSQSPKAGTEVAKGAVITFKTKLV